MKKLNLETIEKLRPFFESEDFETIKLGASLFKSLPEYEQIKNVHIYNSVGGIRDLFETLNYLESANNKYAQKSVSLCLAKWLVTQKVQ